MTAKERQSRLRMEDGRWKKRRKGNDANLVEICQIFFVDRFELEDEIEPPISPFLLDCEVRVGFEVLELSL
jgi:hypothetical protein